MTRPYAAALLSAVLLPLAGCADDEPAEKPDTSTMRPLPQDLCAWVPREHLDGLVVNPPTNSAELGVPTSICTAVAKKGSERSRSVTVILKRFATREQALDDLKAGCTSFRKLAPKDAPREVVAELTADNCVLTGDRRSYALTISEQGDSVLVGVSDTPVAEGLDEVVAISNHLARQLG